MTRFTTGALFIVLAGVIGYFIALPQWEAASAARAENEKLERQLQELNGLKAKRDQLLADYNRLPPETVEKVLSIAPSDKATMPILNDLEAIAKKNQIIVNSISFSEVTNASEGLGGQIGISISMKATLQGFQNFLSDIEKNQRIIDVTQLNFGGDIGTGPLSITLSARAYSRP